MVTEKKDHYTCPQCRFVYRDENLAKKCELWCKEHHTCNLEITKHAIKK